VAKDPQTDEKRGDIIMKEKNSSGGKSHSHFIVLFA